MPQAPGAFNLPAKQTLARFPKRILYVAYPLASVTDESCGGAEQMLYVLEHEMARRGHWTAVAACKYSRAAGELVETGAPAVQFEQLAQRDEEHNRHVVRFVRRMAETGTPVDLVHDEGGRFWTHADAIDVPVLATLNLPRSFYPDDAFQRVPHNVSFNCVSQTQAPSFADIPKMLGVVPNGMPLERFPYTSRKEEYLVWLGRICEEKGLHVALDVAERAGMPLVVLGPSYLYARDKEYFDERVAPRLTSSVKFIGSPTFEQKIAVLRHAKALLMPSLLAETSSLVSMEAMACGTPVVAFGNGALPEVIRDGVTGYIVNTVEQMVEAIPRLCRLRPAAGRVHVERNHSATTMASEYEELYAALSTRAVPSIAAAAMKVAAVGAST